MLQTIIEGSLYPSEPASDKSLGKGKEPQKPENKDGFVDDNNNKKKSRRRMTELSTEEQEIYRTIKKKCKRSYKKEDEDCEREEAYNYTYNNKNTSTRCGGGEETSYDHNDIKIHKFYWKNVSFNGELKKQIIKTEDYDKNGALTEAIVLKDGVEVIYSHKRSDKYK